VNQSTRETLELFVEKADLLKSRNFFKIIQEQGGIKISVSMKIGQPVAINDNVPDPESVDAMMVTFRMFIQDNDRISIRNLSKLLVDPGLSGNWKDRYSQARDTLNQALDGHLGLDLRHEGHTLTARQIMDTFIYGEIAHTNSEKRAQYQRWLSSPMYDFLKYQFASAVKTTLECIFYIAYWSNQEIGKPASNASPV